MNNKNFEHLYFMQKLPTLGIFQVHTTNPTAMVVSMRTWHCFLGPQHLATVKTPQKRLMQSYN